MPQQVPLKNGIGGPVIGTATIQDDGSVVAEITDEDFSGLITADLSNISLSQHPFICPTCELAFGCDDLLVGNPHCVCCSSGHAD